MDLVDIIALFGIMVVLAAVPSTSVVVVVARSISYGFRSGAAAAAGIVTGDILFVIFAIAGLAVLAEALGEYFVIVRYLGGLYLVWFGVSLIRSNDKAQVRASNGTSLLRSYLAGLLITLVDLKAIFFYASLLPAFVEVGALGFSDASVIVAGTVAIVGSVKLGYAYAAHQLGILAERGR